MSAWTDRVDEPFRHDEDFWVAVGLSIDALLALVAAIVVYVLVRGIAVVAFVVPALLLAASAWRGRRSTARTRPGFENEEAWREAERRAVAAAMPGAALRSRLVRR